MPCGKCACGRTVIPSPVQFCYMLNDAEKILKKSIVENGFPYPKGFSVDKDSIKITGIRDGKANVTACGIMVVGACDSGDENHIIGIPAGPLTVHYCLELEKDDGSIWKVLTYETKSPSCKEKCSGTCCICTRYLSFEDLIENLQYQRLYCSTVDCPADEDVVRIPRKDGAVELRLYGRDDKCHHGKYCTYVAKKDSDGFWTIMDKKCPPEK